MDANAEERMREELRRTTVVRLCTLLFLIMSTLVIARVQQSRLEAAAKTRNSAKRLFPWEVSPFLTPESSLLTTAYLDNSQLYSSVFKSHKAQAFSPSKTLLSSSSFNVSFFENHSWSDPMFSDLASSSSSPSPPSLSSSPKSPKLSSPLATPILSLDVSRLHSTEFFPSCHSNSTNSQSSQCYVSLVSTPIEHCASSPSWSCHFPHTHHHSSTGPDTSRDDPSSQCIHVVGSPSTSAIDLAASKFSFCGNPVRHLVAVDWVRNRVFFVQHSLQASPVQEDAQQHHKNNSTTTTVTNTTTSSSLSSFCLSVIYLDNYYADVSDCVTLPLPRDLSFHPSRPPVYLHYDLSTQNLVVFNFDSTGSVVATVIGTSGSLPIRFSIRLEHMSSGWLLTTDNASESSILLLGDKLPYLGVLHVINLENARDTRLDIEDKRMWTLIDDEVDRRKAKHMGHQYLRG